MDDKQKTFNYLKHGFTQDDVLVRITPLQKKSIAHSIMVYGINDKDKTVDINEMYRWGVGYREGMELDYPELLTGDYFSCDPYLGHGSDLDDLCSVDFSYNGEWSDEEKRKLANIELVNDNKHLLIPQILEIDKKLKTHGKIW